MAVRPDFVFLNDGATCLCMPTTEAATKYLAGYVAPDATWQGEALVVERSGALSLAEHLMANGFRVG